MKNKNLLVTIVVLIVGAILAWFGFGDKFGQKADEAGPQKVATSTSADTSNAPAKADKETMSDAAALLKEGADKAKSANTAETKEAGANQAANAENVPDADKPADTAEKMATEEAAKDKMDADKAAVDEQADKAKSEAAKPEATKDEQKAATEQNPDAPSFDVVRVEPDGNTLVAGKAVPGSIVSLMNGDQVLAKATTDESGAWVMILEEALRKGVHDLRLASKSNQDAEAIFSQSNIAVAIPENGELLVVESQPGQASKILAQIAKVDPKAAGKAAKETAKEAMENVADKASKLVETAATAQSNDKDGASEEAEKPAAPQTADASDMKQNDAETADADKMAKDGMDAAAAADAAETEKKQAMEAAKSEAAAAQAEKAIEADIAVKAIELEGDILYVAGDAKPAGSLLRLYVDNRAISDSKSSEAGTFLFDGPIDLQIGRHDVRVDLLGADGAKVLSRAQVSFEKKAPIAAAKTKDGADAGTASANGAQAAGTTSSDAASDQDSVTDAGNAKRKVIIRRGDNLWEIARRVYGAGYRYSTIYDTNSGQIRDPHWIYPGQVFDLPVGETGWEQNFDAVEAPKPDMPNSQ